jgi:tripartite-type tricarboxylate transporter receptor subunit TctC
VPVLFDNLYPSLPQAKQGKLRALGITSHQRSSAAPDIPTVAEAGLPGFESLQWYGLLAPANTPKEIVNRLNKEMVQILQMTDIQKRFATDAVDTVGNSPEEFARHIRAELDKWEKVARGAGIPKS